MTPEQAARAARELAPRRSDPPARCCARWSARSRSRTSTTRRSTSSSAASTTSSGPSAEAKPAYMRDRVHAATSSAATSRSSATSSSIGTGAGGAVVGRELAEAGLAVVFVEEGALLRSHATSPAARSRCSRSCTGAAARRSRSATSAIPIPLGQTVGGTTTVNSGTCYRTPDRVLRRLAARPRARRARARSARAVLRARRERCSASSPRSAELLGGNGRVIARGCDALGFTQHGPLKRNAPECDGQGVCCFGCPTDAKRSTNVSYIPLALQAPAPSCSPARR